MSEEKQETGLEQSSSSTHRLSINLPSTAYEELQLLSTTSGSTMTEIVRTALGLVRLAYEEDEEGNFLAVADSTGTVLRQIVLPR